jgi:hypothetical protein
VNQLTFAVLDPSYGCTMLRLGADRRAPIVFEHCEQAEVDWSFAEL